MNLMLKSILVMSAMLGSSPVFSSTYCGSGTIKMFRYTWGLEDKQDSDSSLLRIRTATMSAPDGSYGYGRTIALNRIADPVRWTERLNMLQLALAMQYPVNIYMSGSDCVGPMTELDLSVCPPSSSDCDP